MLGIIVLIYKSYEQILTYVSSELSKVTLPHVTLIVNAGATLEESQNIADALHCPVVSQQQHIATDMAVLHLDENLGYARGNNLGVQVLLNSFPDIDKLLFSNDDIQFLDDDVVEKLAARIDELPSVAAIGPLVLDMNNVIAQPIRQHKSIWYYVRRNLGEPFFGAAAFPKYTTPDTRKPAPVCMVSGCFFMVKTADFLAAGMFDPRTFLYWEEEILSVRLDKIGKTAYFSPEASIRHFVGLTTSKHSPNLLLLKCELDGQMLFFSVYKPAGWFPMLMLKLSAIFRTMIVWLVSLKHKLLFHK